MDKNVPYLAKVTRVSFRTRENKQYAEVSFQYYAMYLLFPTEQTEIVTVAEDSKLWDKIKTLRAGDELKAYPESDEIAEVKKHNPFVRWFLLNCQRIEPPHSSF